MKLISLYIENFGTLSGYELTFGDGITTIVEPNGFGKTTLAEFIRAMFYGFPRKSKTLEKSKRQKYLPWNGGVCGGNLIFEQDGQRFRLERTFGAVPKNDTFTLIDLATGRKSTRYCEEIGMEIFGLDGDSFERSTYLPQMGESGPLSTAAMEAKLTNLVEDGDVANFDRAMTALRLKRSALIPYRGNSGAAAEADGNITRLQQQLEQAQKCSLLLEHAQEEVKQKETAEAEAKDDLARIRQQLQHLAEASIAADRQRQYDQLREQHRQAAEKCAQFAARYPAGFPEEQPLQEAERMADRFVLLTEQTAALSGGPLPSSGELEQCRQGMEKLNTLQEKLQKLQLQMEQLQLTYEHAPSAGLGTFTVVMVLGLLAAAAGAVLLALHHFVPGGFTLGAGLLAFLTALFFRHRETARRKKIRQDRCAAARQEMEALQSACDKIESDMQRFFSLYFNSVAPRQYPAYLVRQEQLVQQQDQLHGQILTCRRKLESFFGAYGLPWTRDPRMQLRQLRLDAHDAAEIRQTEEHLRRQIAALEAEYGAQLHMQLPRAMDVQRLKEKEADQQREVTALQEEILSLRQRIRQLQQQTDDIPQLREALQHWLGRKAGIRENARILDDTMAFLQQARDGLSGAYLGTVRTRFAHYIRKLEGLGSGKFLVTPDFEVQPEHMGQARDLAYFSAGESDMVMLCMRMALVDALFRNEDMFVILDDPFTNLDDSHTAQAMALLQELGKTHQILYLTCHSSRAV